MFRLPIAEEVFSLSIFITVALKGILSTITTVISELPYCREKNGYSVPKFILYNCATSADGLVGVVGHCSRSLVEPPLFIVITWIVCDPR